ncbi:MAG: sugar transferase [Clostridia bacterium]|nr:sugar transferase [Clostridia bacterium]
MNKTVEKTERKPIRKNIGYRFAKRAFDIVCSLLALVVLSPVFLVTAVAILVEDGGPVMYKQKRIGKDKKEFNIYKFRSMRKDAEKIHEQMKAQYKSGEVSFKLDDKTDPRITKVGRFIRKTSIDELPQLVNIIAGHMSIVGPRPLPTYEYEDEQKKFGGVYDDRYDVPQGLTCYWQVTFGERGKISFADRMQMDVDYARDAKMWVDIKLIWKTFVGVLFGISGY